MALSLSLSLSLAFVLVLVPALVLVLVFVLVLVKGVLELNQGGVDTHHTLDHRPNCPSTDGKKQR